MNQHEQIIDLHCDGKWHCSTEIEYIRDQRKRISELRQRGYVFESKPCARYCGKAHSSRLFMRRLISSPTEAKPLNEPYVSPTPENPVQGQMEASENMATSSFTQPSLAL